MPNSSRLIHPVSGPIEAEVSVPGSKSDTNRALIVAALAEGRSVLTGALFSDDTRYMMDALRQLGFVVAADEPAHTLTVDGLGGHISADRADLFVGLAGTAMRFLTAFVALGQGRYRIDGTERMRQRPIQPLLDSLNQLGVCAVSEYGTGCPPVVVESKGMTGGTARMAGHQSSQYFTALLLVGPCTPKGLDIEVEGAMVHTPYIDLTATVMRRFGAMMRHENYRRLYVPGAQRYRATAYSVEPDASAASYFFAAAALTGGRVRVHGLGRECAQGDIRFVEVLEKMGCRVCREKDAVEVTGPSKLRGIDVDMGDISDTALTLAAIAPFANGPVIIRGLGHTRLQETDRVAAPVAELRKLGVSVEEHPDAIVIQPAAPHGGEVETYDDHRMAMSFALIGLRTPGVVILNPGCTAKTFPDFFERLDQATGQSSGG
ncbi:MAG: 3-phosphoshikimate 1-carboxyvinyltransferase [candidate division Zixibacteria bacterium]|nr:3-phosphoshikimate 1-carboxyvinyltransferase [candidate division Zixibacteria bacterium]